MFKGIAANWQLILAIIAIVITVGLAYNQTSRDIGALQSDVRHLEQGQRDLSAQIDRRFDDLLVQLAGHQHNADGHAVFSSP